MNCVIRVGYLCLAGLMGGCGQHSNTPERPTTAIQRIEAIDVNLNHDQSFSEYHARVDGQIRDVVRHVPSASNLRALFHECVRRRNSPGKARQDRLQWIDAFHSAKIAILFRLAEMESDDAAKVLVNLYADETLHWDGESALNVLNAISRCGRRALPYLTGLHSPAKKRAVLDLISCIDRGELYGP